MSLVSENVLDLIDRLGRPLIRVAVYKNNIHNRRIILVILINTIKVDKCVRRVYAGRCIEPHDLIDSVQRLYFILVAFAS